MHDTHKLDEDTSLVSVSLAIRETEGKWRKAFVHMCCLRHASNACRDQDYGERTDFRPERGQSAMPSNRISNQGPK